MDKQNFNKEIRDLIDRLISLYKNNGFTIRLTQQEIDLLVKALKDYII